MVSLTQPKTINLEFEKSGIVQLQYLPSELTINETDKHNSQATLDGKVAFVAPRNSHERRLRVGAYFTAFISQKEADNIAGLRVAQGSAVALGAVNTFGSEEVFKVLSTIKQTLSLAKGVYDLGSGLIGPASPVNSAIGDLKNSAMKVQLLTRAKRNGEVFVITYDLDQDPYGQGKVGYILNNFNLTARRLSDTNAQTLEFAITLDAFEAGDVINIQR